MSRIMGLGVNEHVIPKNINEFRKGFSFNTGDLLFNFAAELLVRHDVSGLSRGMGADNINKGAGSILLPMANQIGRHVNILEKGPDVRDIQA